MATRKGYKIGEKVRLKSGGPVMTVIGGDKDGTECIRFNGTIAGNGIWVGEFATVKNVPPKALERVSSATIVNRRALRVLQSLIDTKTPEGVDELRAQAAQVLAVVDSE